MQGRDDWQHHHEWMMLELYDQTVRERPGGAIVEYLEQDPIPNEAFVYERWGSEARGILQALRETPTHERHQRLGIRDLALSILHFPQSVRAGLLGKLLDSDDQRALQIGRFRLRGEVHQWMYDRYSLARLQQQAGFQNPTQRAASESAIENWAQFGLDTEPDGTVRKPDSLYMEAVKPTS